MLDHELLYNTCFYPCTASNSKRTSKAQIHYKNGQEKQLLSWVNRKVQKLETKVSRWWWQQLRGRKWRVSELIKNNLNAINYTGTKTITIRNSCPFSLISSSYIRYTDLMASSNVWHCVKTLFLVFSHRILWGMAFGVWCLMYSVGWSSYKKCKETSCFHISILLQAMA